MVFFSSQSPDLLLSDLWMFLQVSVPDINTCQLGEGSDILLWIVVEIDFALFGDILDRFAYPDVRKRFLVISYVLHGLFCL